MLILVGMHLYDPLAVSCENLFLLNVLFLQSCGGDRVRMLTDRL
jgi:hypothetical protein